MPGAALVLPRTTWNPQACTTQRPELKHSREYANPTEHHGGPGIVKSCAHTHTRTQNEPQGCSRHACVYSCIYYDMLVTIPGYVILHGMSGYADYAMFSYAMIKQ